MRNGLSGFQPRVSPALARASVSERSVPLHERSTITAMSTEQKYAAEMIRLLASFYGGYAAKDFARAAAASDAPSRNAALINASAWDAASAKAHAFADLTEQNDEALAEQLADAGSKSETASMTRVKDEWDLFHLWFAAVHDPQEDGLEDAINWLAGRYETPDHWIKRAPHWTTLTLLTAEEQDRWHRFATLWRQMHTRDGSQFEWGGGQ